MKLKKPSRTVNLAKKFQIYNLPPAAIGPEVPPEVPPDLPGRLGTRGKLNMLKKYNEIV